MEPREHIKRIRNRYLSSDNYVLEGLAGSTDLHQMEFPSQWHFLMEFIQNAEDAQSSKLRIEMTESDIFVLNDGEPFQHEDVESICTIGQSGKKLSEKSEDYIGYLGVGFKSVFLITDNPQIHSGEYYFEFDKNAWKHSDKVPWRICPRWIEKENQLELKPPYNTAFKIPILQDSESEITQNITNSLKTNRISDRTLLFLKNLDEIEIVDKKNGYRSRILKSDTDDRFNKDNYQIHKFDLYENDQLVKKSRWLTFASKEKIPEEVSNDHYTKQWERDGLKKREIIIGFSVDENYHLEPQIGTAHMGVFSFLPLKEMKSGLNFLVQADFLTAPGREIIHREAKWNTWLAKQIFSLIVDTIIPSFKDNDKWKYTFTKLLNPGEGGHEIFVKNIHDPLLEYIRTNEVLLDHHGTFIRPEDAIKVDPDLQNITSKEILDEVYDEKYIIHPQCKYPKSLKRSTIRRYINDGPSYSGRNGSNDEQVKAMDELLKIYSERGDTNFFKNFYSMIDTKVSDDLETSRYTIKEIILTEEYTLKKPDEVYILPDNLSVPTSFDDNFNFVHPDLINKETSNILSRLGVKEITESLLDDKLRETKFDTFNERWGSLNKNEKIEHTEICFNLWNDNKVSSDELDFLTLLSEESSWIQPSKAIFPEAFNPDHNLETLKEQGLIDKHLSFISSEYLNNANEETVILWNEFFSELGAESDLSKKTVSEQVAINTSIRYEEENGRSPQIMPRHKEIEGYDIKSHGKSDQRFIEVKGRMSPSPSIKLTPTQLNKLNNENSYYIYIVRSAFEYPPILSVIKGERISEVDQTIEIKYSDWDKLKEDQYRP